MEDTACRELQWVSSGSSLHMDSPPPYRYKKHISSYVKDSEDLQNQLLKVHILSDGLRIGSSDAVSMYTIIDTAHNLLTIEQWLTKISPHLPSSFPKNLILEAIKLVMENNIFLFGNQHYLQKTGTAMGTPCACILATIYFSLHEDFLIQKYSN